MRGRPFVALIAADTFSISGSRLAAVALPWLVLQMTGSAVLTGAVALAEMLPAVVFRALGGPWIDRLGARRVAVTGDLLSIVIVALVPALHAAGILSIWTLLPTVFLLGVLRGPADAAKNALVPEVTRLVGLPLERVTGAASMVERLGSTVGAAAAGGLVAWIGPAEALLINCGAFALSALFVHLGIPRRGMATEATTATRPGYLGELKQGWHFLRRDPVLVGIVIMVAITNLLDQAYGAVLVPVWAEASGSGAALIGLAFAAFSAASIAGSALAALLGERLPRLPVYVVAFILTGLPRFVVFALGAHLPVLLATLALAGFASGFLNPILGAVIYERIPGHLLGRVSALTTALGFGLMPFGGLIAGLLIEATTLAWAFAICGVLYFAATLMPLAWPGFRAFGTRPSGVRRA